MYESRDKYKLQSAHLTLFWSYWTLFWSYWTFFWLFETFWLLDIFLIVGHFFDFWTVSILGRVFVHNPNNLIRQQKVFSNFFLAEFKKIFRTSKKFAKIKKKYREFIQNSFKITDTKIFKIQNNRHLNF